MRPPHAKTWGRRGQTPVVTVRGRGSGRVNIAGLTCYRLGHHSRLFYRLLVYHGRKNEKKGLLPVFLMPSGALALRSRVVAFQLGERRGVDLKKRPGSGNSMSARWSWSGCGRTD